MKNRSNSNHLSDSGFLTLVATPIGNYGDISERALDALRNSDLIAAEDTRITSSLLSHFQIGKPLESYHEHNSREKGDKLLEMLKQGKKIVLVSDAGMPCISDPGEALVRLCIEHDIAITVVPGANAALSALSASGLDTSAFSFEGFLSVENKPRREQLERVKTDTRTIILYEAPHRLERTLTDLEKAGLGGRWIVLARELTKRYEQWLRMTIAEACIHYKQEKPRGEFVLVIEGIQEYNRRCPADPADVESEAREIMRTLMTEGLSVKEASKQAADTGLLKKNDFYRIGLDLQSDEESV